MMKEEIRRRGRRCAGLILAVGLLSAGSSVLYAGPTDEPLVIAASPGMKGPVEALAQSFEKIHPNVKVKVYYDTGLDLRRTIAAVGNDLRFFIGTGPIDLVAPGGDELIARLESKYYVLPGTRHSYAAVPLVLVVPVSLVEAPSLFEELGKTTHRIAIADPILTELGRQTGQLFASLGIADDVKKRLDVASDARGVLDHLLYGQADVGVIFGPDAVKEQERIRVVATAADPYVRLTVHSMAMERYCRNRSLCEEFLTFIQSPEAQGIVRSLGYLPGTES
ncbi:MAG: molybdate ABC transporter substrate-binding protein [Nitrospira sp.]|nr:molybdate ABC transporter substrate-binding protein [Nitrospira sp.]